MFTETKMTMNSTEAGTKHVIFIAPVEIKDEPVKVDVLDEADTKQLTSSSTSSSKHDACSGAFKEVGIQTVNNLM